MNTIFLQGIGAISLIPENGSNSLGGIVFMMNTRPDEIVSVGLHLTSVGVSDVGFKMWGPKFGLGFRDQGTLSAWNRCDLHPGADLIRGNLFPFHLLSTNLSTQMI